MGKIKYWNRIFKAYLFSNNSQLSFWHGLPEQSLLSNINSPKKYYMKFHYKANYNNHLDINGIPLLNYHGSIGLQYNPIAIAQYGLGNYNLFLDTNDKTRLDKFIHVSDWLVENLKLNIDGIPVWMHNFDFEYKTTLKDPWYSGLAQGLGISTLIRAYKETNNQKYLDAYEKAWISMTKNINEGGVLYVDDKGNYWIEEYILESPTHILNGFIWALWGVYDAWKLLENSEAKDLFHKCCKTLETNLKKYDNKYWSLYELSNTYLPMISSPFYHNLHIVQLKIMWALTSSNCFLEFSTKWEEYGLNRVNRVKAILNKSLFKILYY
tara:strand:- start:26396 stop:27367 length:972 start_codon:yes stop_codon:yes gene_type:complete